MAENELHEQEPRRVEVVGSPVLLYRYGGTIYATAAVCGHAGGPLEQGQFDEYCVQCPWHDSVYDLRDGSIVHGPTTYTLPKYAARIQNGQVEIRAEWQ
jgi:nitrite reductase/ring-hydroxylating ferredoxin subunit